MATPTICIIDDERDVCDLLRLMLESRNYQCLVAHDGEEGLEMVRRSNPALLILDIKMPRVNGYEIILRLRSQPQTAQLPILVVTGITEKSGRTDAEWAEKLSVQALITKPLDTEQLLGQVQKLLART